MAWTSLKHRYSYSGSDAKAYAYFKANSPGYAWKNEGKGVQLEAMHTISFSIFEAKGRVRSLGFKSIRGFTRAVREISGTMIMMVIEDHPLAGLMAINPSNRNEVYGISDRSWSLDGKSTAISARGNAGPHAGYFKEQDQMRRAPTTLPPFNIMIEYNTEVPDSVMTNGPQPGGALGYRDVQKSEEMGDYSRTIYGVRDSAAIVELIDVEIMGQGIVTSVNDMVTEVQYQFVARDYREFMKETKAIEELWSVDDPEEMLKKADNEHLKEIRDKNKQVEVKTDGSVEITTPVNEMTDTLDEAAKSILLNGLYNNPLATIDDALKKIDQVGSGGTSSTSLELKSAADMKDPEVLKEAQIKTWDIVIYQDDVVHVDDLPEDHPLVSGVHRDSKFVSMTLLKHGEAPGQGWVNNGFGVSTGNRYQIITTQHNVENYTMVDSADAIEYSELRNKLIEQGDLYEAE